MIRNSNKALYYFHILMGLFFSTVGIILIVQSNVLKGIWLFLLGLLFLFDFLQHTLFKFPQRIVSIVTIILAVLIIVTGVYVLSYQ